MAWKWQYLDSKGNDISAPSAAVQDGFGTQADAETWLGDNWRELVDDGIAAVSLFEEGRQVYGPMSLEDAD
jgi:hypothetical protein